MEHRPSLERGSVVDQVLTVEKSGNEYNKQQLTWCTHYY